MYWIILAIVAGIAVGVPLSMVPLTAVPQRTALSHAFGGLAAGLVGTAEYYLWYGHEPRNLTADQVLRRHAQRTKNQEILRWQARKLPARRILKPRTRG